MAVPAGADRGAPRPPGGGGPRHAGAGGVLSAAARAGAALERLEREVARILGVLTRTGALRVAPEALQPADILLDLYGEDIRARAFTTRDEAGERMLRPDFTVPIVRLHMEGRAEPARYAYAGPVWRRQEAGSSRPAEYLQAGIELFDGADPAEADAEVFGLVAEAVRVPGVAADALEVATGDMGLILAAIDALPTAPHRRRALRRHVWRPAAFRRLLDRFGRRHAELAAARAPLIATFRSGGAAAAIAEAGAFVGLRAPAEIEARLARLAEEAETPPLARSEIDMLEAVMAGRGSAAEALAAFRAIAAETPALRPAAERLAARLAALARAGFRPEALPFEATFGRTTLEYYDGFVFGFRARGRDDLPPLASGGRYDALTRILGDRTVPAVGGIVRPEALLALQGGTA
jgi:ATP phosphoribosyltransferase regulatory subunit